MNITQQRKRRQKLAADYLASHDLDAVLLSRRCNFSWYTCGAHNYVGDTCDVGNSWLLVRKDSAVVLANNIEATRLGGEELTDSGIEVVGFPYYDPAAQVAAFDKAIGSARVAVDAAVPGRDLPFLDADFDRLRWQLSDWETARYRALCGDTSAAVEAVARAARIGQTESALAGMLTAELRRRGAMPWVLLVAADERISRYRHPLPTDRTLEKHLMLVTCAERGGLISAVTRLVSFGKLSAELQDKHHAVATVDTALIGATRPGATLGDIFAEAQAAYAETGYADEWKLHHQGGSCGYLPREVKAAPGCAVKVLENQPFAWNPSITGTKCEDTVLATADGPRILTASGDWPTLTAEWKGTTLDRPDILVR